MSDLRPRVIAYFRGLQDRISEELARVDGGTTPFREDTWDRPGGGGGRSRILEEGALFERAGVNFSEVHGEISPQMEAVMPGDGVKFHATGISLVFHPRSPRIPTVHANFRCLTRGSTTWFGGGSDLTPYYLNEDDAKSFHAVWKAACDRYDPTAYARFKAECDRYFHLPHRGEARGVGGIFFDYQKDDLERVFAFVQDAGNSFLNSYLPIVARRQAEPYGEAEREWQLVRRGRYVEFNLIHDRGTTFGLRTGGRTESILMSLPPQAKWKYDHVPTAGSQEAVLLEVLRQPRAWT